jgi:hypothetical protein
MQSVRPAIVFLAGVLALLFVFAIVDALVRRRKRGDDKTSLHL